MSLSRRLGWTSLASACALALISGCSGSASSPKNEHPDTSTGGLHITKLLAVEMPNNVLAYDVSWKTSRAADTELDVDCGKTVAPWTISDSTASTTHHVFLMGLVTGVSCGLTAKAKSADGGTASSWKKITVSDLPDYLPPIDLTRSAQAGTVVPGWTLINLSNEQLNVPYVAALLDSKGRFRWYYQYPSPAPGNDTPVFQYKDGVVIGGREVPLSYVTWQGELVWADESGEYFHHEARLGETPNRFYTLGNLMCPPLVNYGDYIAEYDSDLKKDVWTWSLCDHYVPPEDVPDWGHLNTVALFPDHQFLLTSSRNQNSLFKIDRATGDVIWTMGFDGDPLHDPFKGDFTISVPDRFYQQHDTTILPNGHILMFDNGYYGVRNWSRGLEVAYTYNPGGVSEAHVVWQFRHNPDIFAPIWGSTQRFNNGNTLICFGQRDPGVQSTVDEVSADSKLLWEFTTPEFWGVYRAERIPVQHGKVLSP